MRKLIFLLVLMIGIYGCGKNVHSICREDVRIIMLRMSSLPLTIETSTDPTIAQLMQAPHMDTIVDERRIGAICKRMSELLPVENQSAPFPLRVVCLVDYSDKTTDTLLIDTYGEVKSKGMVFEDSYSLLKLMEIVCIDPEE